MSSRSGVAGPIVVVALLLSGCPTLPRPTLPFDEAAEAMESHRSMRRPARILRAEARVDRRDGEGRVRGTVMMFIERDDHVRFDVMTQFGPAAILTSDGEEFALTDLRDNEFYVGPTCPSNIERLLGLRFSAPEVTRLLLGETPYIEYEERTIESVSGGYRVVLRASDGRRQELDIGVRQSDLGAPPAAQRLRLRRSEVFAADGATEWRVTYDDYRFIEDPTDDASPRRGVAMPMTVRFVDPRVGADTQIRFQRVDLNVEVPEGAFSQSPRPGLTQHRVGCEG